MLLEDTNVLILDDEPDALEQSREALAQFVRPERILAVSQQAEALDLITQGKVDLLFLDVEMPGMDGFSLADVIHRLNPELKYVFLTGHTELGADSYDHEPIGFLPKPVDPVRLLRTLERYRDSRTSTRKQRGKVALDTKDGFILLAPEDIRYIAKEGRRTVIHCMGEDHQIQQTLDALEVIFSDFDYFRIHQSVLAPLERIISVKMADFGNTFSAILDDGTRLPVSRRSYAKLREHLAARGVRFV